MRRANPAIIGGFIVGAVVLVIAGVVVFGSGKFFQETVTCVMYFEGSLQGLHVGAPVNFRGVKVGSITDITMRLDPQTWQLRIPVMAVFPKGSYGNIALLSGSSGAPHEVMAALIRRGLRAQLQTDSLVTGRLFVQLDLYPASYLDAPPSGDVTDPQTGLLEIPTVPTTLQEVSNTIRRALDKLAEMPLEQMLREMQEALSGINRLVNAPEVREAIRNANATFTEMQHLIRHADHQLALIGASATAMLKGLDTLIAGIQPLAQSMQQLVQQVDKQLGQVATSAGAALGNVSKLSDSVDRHALALTTGLTQTIAAALRTFEQMRDTLAAAHQLLMPNAPIGYELVKTLRELSEAARSLRELTDYLERHPNAVIFGRKGGGTR